MGKQFFDSELFNVTVWDLTEDFKTTITCVSSNPCVSSNQEIDFDGSYETKFNTDEACMNELTFEEIMQMMRMQANIAFEKGRQDKLIQIKNQFKEFKKILEIF